LFGNIVNNYRFSFTGTANRIMNNFTFQSEKLYPPSTNDFLILAKKFFPNHISYNVNSPCYSFLAIIYHSNQNHNCQACKYNYSGHQELMKQARIMFPYLPQF
jgi:hypothetical protein